MQTSLEYVVAKLNQHKGRWSAVAAGSGVSVRTFSKIARQETRNPQFQTVEQLANYFRSLESR